MSIKKQYQQVHKANTTGFAFGLFIGATAGALLGMLWKPKSGNQMIRNLRGIANQGMFSLKKGWKDVRSMTSKAANKEPKRLGNKFVETDGIYG